ncbi:MAG: iron-containing redox enzyme family protein [Actinomycetota bacterium]
MISATEVARRLDEATAKRRILEHPFYEAWAAGSLTLDDLGSYSAQYWRQVEAFPTYLTNLAESLPHGTARKIVESNLRDEVDGDHAGLWLKFAAGVGSDELKVTTTPPTAETRRCVHAFETATSRSSSYALGMVYGYESQTPAVAQTKVAGLRDHYGIDGPATDYFELHGNIDVHHSRELAEAIALTSDGSLEEAEAGAAAGAEAIWMLLDGVERLRQHSTN